MNSNKTYPGIRERTEAFFIDGILEIIVLIAIAKILQFFPTADESYRILLCLSFVGLYDPIATSFFGCTVGQYIKKMHVRQVHNENAKILFILAIVRFVLKISLGSISYFTIPRDKKNRAIHDYCAGSVDVFR